MITKRPNHRPLKDLTTNEKLKEDYYTIEETAKKLKVHPNTIRRAIWSKRLKAVMFGNKWLIPKEELQDQKIFKKNSMED